MTETVDATVNSIREAGSAITGMAGALLDTNPNLVKFSAGLGGVNKIIGYLTTNLTNLRKFASMGADFGMDISQMTISVTGARSSFEALDAMLKSNTSSLALYNGTIGSGLDTFLAMQRDFYFDASGAATDASLGLERLGLTTEQINEQFLVHDRLQRYGRRTEQVNIAQRNASAAAFAKELTTMARLTGQQADAMTASLNKVVREGDVAAFSRRLDAPTAAVFSQTITTFDAVSDMFGALTRDIVIRKRPMEDTMTLYSQIPETVQKLYEAEQATIAKNAPLARQLFDEALMIYSREMQTGSIGILAEQQNATRETTDAMRASAEYASGVGVALGDQLLRREEELGRALTGPETTAIIDQFRQRINSLGDAPPPGDPRAATEALIRAEQELASMAVAVQTQMRGVYTTLGESATEFLTLVRGAGAKAAETTVGLFSDAIAMIGITGQTSVQERNRVAEAAIERLNEAGSTTEAQNLAEIQTRLNRLDALPTLTAEQQAERDALITQFRGAVNASPRLTQVEQMRVTQLTVEGAVINGALVNPNTTPVPTAPPTANGTIGAFGSILQDFGRETVGTFHGREAVLNERQLTNLASGIYNYSGAVNTNMAYNALDRLSQGVASPEMITRTITASLGGMLNTVRNNQSRSMPLMQELDLSGIESEIGKISSQMRKPFEDALNATLRPSLDTIAATTALSNDLQKQSVRGIQGMGNDYLRGA